MPSISITVNDAQARALISRAPGRINVAMRGAMEDATTYVLARIKRYPPQRAGSTYRRTGTLGRSWGKRIEGSGLTIRGIVGSSGNIAPHNRKVQDRTQQSRIHRGRWQTIQSVAEDEQNRVRHMFEDRLRAAGLDRP